MKKKNPPFKIIDGKKCRAVYLVCTNDEFELPLLVADTVKEVARFIGTTPKHCSENIAHNIRATRGFILERVYIPIDY